MKSKQKLISIALATYNGERYLHRQLDSIFNQTYKNLEVIASDDCSSDGTIEILKEYKKKYGLKYSVNKKNLGFVKNFENAINKCKGDYIALADQDDIWMPNKIERLVNEIGDYSLICSDAELIDGKDMKIADSFRKYSNNYIAEGKNFTTMVFRNFVTGCTSLVTRNLIVKTIPIPDGVHHHDWWLALIAAKTNGIKYLDETLIKYRQHSYNDTGANKKINIFQKLNEFTQKQNKGHFQKEIINLQAMLNSTYFTGEEKAILKDRLLFYKDILNTKLHFRAFKVAYKYRKHMLAGRSLIYKIFFIMGSLVKS